MKTEQLHFTAHVLGKKATSRLKNHQVTQTIRSGTSSLVLAISDWRIKPGDLTQVTLDDETIGHARHVSMDKVHWDDLTIEDAQRGGFDNCFELAYALKRAGYRFLPLDKYQFYRCRFSWLEENECLSCKSPENAKNSATLVVEGGIDGNRAEAKDSEKPRHQSLNRENPAV